MRRAFTAHWREYLIETAGLGFFMLSACAFGSLFEHPDSPIHRAIGDPTLRRGLMGLAMGVTAVFIIYSPWGKRSGAHINPSVTLAFFRLGRVAPWDAVFYALAQFTGAVGGVALAHGVLGATLAAPTVHFVVTAPGMRGLAVAFGAEVAISAILFWCVLTSAASPRSKRYTGLIAGGLVATYILVEAPLSGMSMNPARSFGSAIIARAWQGQWIYFLAPPLGMLLAAQLYRGQHAGRVPPCAKMCHVDGAPCLFCDYHHGRQ